MATAPVAPADRNVAVATVAPSEAPIIDHATASERMPLGQWLRTTPGLVRLFSIVAVVGLIAVGSPGTGALTQRRDAAESVATSSGPQLITASDLYASLSAADATASSALLRSGSRAHAEVRDRYLERPRAGASRLLVDLSRALRRSRRRPTRRPGRSRRSCPTYAGRVETARTNSRSGNPVGAAYMRAASAQMRDEILPAATTIWRDAAVRLQRRLRRRDLQRLVSSRFVVAGGAVALVALVALAIFLDPPDEAAGSTSACSPPRVVLLLAVAASLLADGPRARRAGAGPAGRVGPRADCSRQHHSWRCRARPTRTSPSPSGTPARPTSHEFDVAHRPDRGHRRSPGSSTRRGRWPSGPTNPRASPPPPTAFDAYLVVAERCVTWTTDGTTRTPSSMRSQGRRRRSGGSRRGGQRADGGVDRQLRAALHRRGRRRPCRLGRDGDRAGRRTGGGSGLRARGRPAPDRGVPVTGRRRALLAATAARHGRRRRLRVGHRRRDHPRRWTTLTPVTTDGPHHAPRPGPSSCDEATTPPDASYRAARRDPDAGADARGDRDAEDPGRRGGSSSASTRTRSTSRTRREMPTGFVGFEPDLARLIARAIFGDDDPRRSTFVPGRHRQTRSTVVEERQTST